MAVVRSRYRTFRLSCVMPVGKVLCIGALHLLDCNKTISLNISSLPLCPTATKPLIFVILWYIMVYLPAAKEFVHRCFSFLN